MAETEKRRVPTDENGRPLSREEMAERRERARQRAVARSKRRFRRFFWVYTAVILLLGGVGLGVLYRYLDAYEQSQGKYVMEEFLASHSDDDYLEILLSAPTLELGEFESSEEVMTRYFESSCRGQRYSYREAAGVSSAEKPVYTVKAGKYDVCRVTLTPAEDLPFGFHRYRLESCVPYVSPYALTATSIAIEAPEDEPVFLNGREVSAAYITDDNIPCTELTALERRYASAPHRVLYEVSGLYGDITVTDGSGSEVYPSDGEEQLFYRLGGEGGYSFTVTAPANASVYVCDTLLGGEEITARGDDLFAGLEQYTGGVSSAAVTYSLTGLYRKPVIRVEAPEGCRLEQSEGEDGAVLCRYLPDEALQREQQPLVEKFFAANMGYGAGNNGELPTLLQLTLYGSELYNYFANSTAAMIWASDTTITYDYLNYSDFIPCGEDAFTCRVSYKAHLKSQSWYETTDSVLEDAYDLAFVRHNNQWYAAAMAIVE